MQTQRSLIWVFLIVFVLAGIAFAWTHRFESWAGGELEKAAPTARRVLPPPAKRVLRETREHLPVYGSASTWLARKSASVVYFGIVGLFVLALRRRRPETIAETLLVTVVAGAGMSAMVEILEWPEDIGDVTFDLFCGAAGGLLAGFLVWPWLRHK